MATVDKGAHAGPRAPKGADLIGPPPSDYSPRRSHLHGAQGLLDGFRGFF